MTKDRLSYLLHAYYNNSCNQAEENELLQWIALHGDNSWVQEIIDEIIATHRVDSKMSEEQAGEVYSSLKQRLLPNQVEVPVISKSRPWVRIAAAASITLVVATAVYIWSNRSMPADTSAKNGGLTDVPAHSTKTTLTLADGSVITLDSAGAGALAQQGSTHIIKEGDGALSYKTDSYGKTTITVPQLNVLSTPRGGQYTLTLSDGSRVWLNAASSLSFPVGFTGRERLVELNGEGYFEVAKNSEMPFKVIANGTTVEALGTVFNIQAYTDEVTQRTTLVEGKVKVSRADNMVILAPGQQASVADAGSLTTGNVDTDEVIAWKQGYFQFKNMPIEFIMRQVARWYDVNVEYRGKITKKFSLLNVPRSVTATEMFKILEQTGNVRFEIKNKKVTVIAVAN